MAGPAQHLVSCFAVRGHTPGFGDVEPWSLAWPPLPGRMALGLVTSVEKLRTSCRHVDDMWDPGLNPWHHVVLGIEPGAAPRGLDAHKKEYHGLGDPSWPHRPLYESDPQLSCLWLILTPTRVPICSLGPRACTVVPGLWVALQGSSCLFASFFNIFSSNLFIISAR